MSTRFLSRIQIDRNLRKSTEHVEIVPQETCVHHESTESMAAEYATSTIVKNRNSVSSSSGVPPPSTLGNLPRRASEATGMMTSSK